MSHSAQIGNIKASVAEQAILGHSASGDIFPPGTAIASGMPEERQRFSVLRPPGWRPGNSFGQVPAGAFTEQDIIILPYEFPPGPRGASMNLATSLLKEFRQGDLSQNTVGIEEEGDIYRDNGGSGELIAKYDGIHFSAQNDAHPEMTSSKVETATGPLADGRYPASALELAQALALSTLEAHQTARMRGAFYVQASVSEGGDVAQVEITDHPYIRTLFPIRAESYRRHAQSIPEETRAIWRKIVGKELDFRRIDYGNPPLHGTVNATHVHISNPLIPGSENIYDARIAYTYGLLRLTQMSKVMNFCLYNTRHLLSIPFDGIKDIRSYLRRTMDSAHNASIPGNARDFFLNALMAVAEGQCSYFSRYPVRGQHDRLRIKEVGTTEATDGAANPDLRLVLAMAYYYQICSVFALKALEATQGDEAQVGSWLRKCYGPLFQIIPTMQGRDNSFQQDRSFHTHGWQGKSQGETFANQLIQVKKLLNDIKGDFPGLQTQIKIVSQTIENVLAEPLSQITLQHYLGTNGSEYQANKLNRGLIIDYKTNDIRENLLAQSVGSEKQAQFLLKQVRDEKDLVEGFFGIAS